MKKYYFAYGSNLSLNQVKERNLSMKLLHLGILEHYKIMFNKRSKKNPLEGFANIVPSWNDFVVGAIFEIIDEADIKILDKFEGYPIHYEKTNIHVQSVDKKGFYLHESLFPCLTYIATSEMQSSKNLKVSEVYSQKMNEGLELLEEIPNEYKDKIKNLMK